MYGCAPSKGVNSATTMVYDIIDCMKSNIDWRNMTVPIPHVFNHLRLNDSNLEIATSGTLQNLNLSLNAVSVKRSKAIVFSNTMSEPEAINPKYLFETDLKFASTEIHRNLKKSEIIEVLDELQ